MNAGHRTRWSRTILCCAVSTLAVFFLVSGLGLRAGEPKTKAARPKAKKTAKKTKARTSQMPEDLKVIDNITYKQVGDEKLDLLIIQPEKTKYEKAPVMVYIHGGGWGSGDRYRITGKDRIEVVRELGRQGVACASVEYRLTNKGPATAMESVADCMDALAFLAEHAADYGIDPQRMGTFGTSAGGHLSLVTALGKPSDYPCDPAFDGARVPVRCEVAYYPATTFVDPEPMKGSNFEKPNRLVPILGGLVDEKRDVAEKLSPAELLTKDSPPVLLVHGDEDKTLSCNFSTYMADRAKEIGAPVECLIVHGAGHGLSGETLDPTLEEVDRRTTKFFLAHLTEGE